MGWDLCATLVTNQRVISIINFCYSWRLHDLFCGLSNRTLVTMVQLKLLPRQNSVYHRFNQLKLISKSIK